MHMVSNAIISINGTALVSTAPIPVQFSSAVLKTEGFVRYGNLRHKFGLACVLSNSTASRKRMYVGVKHAGETWTDILEWCTKNVIIDNRGYGIFPVAAKSVCVWVNSQAEGRRSLNRPL